MQLITDLSALERGRPAILTIGALDGVHRGHQFLIRQVIDRARRLDYDSVVLTFDPRPEVVLRPGTLQLSDAEAKVRIVSALGPDVLGLLPFTRDVSQIAAGQFLVSVLDHINVAEFWVGADFAFGHNREGTVDFLIRNGQTSGFAVHVLPRQKLHGTAISSSLIRRFIAEGELDRASAFLGHYYGFAGPVVRGAGRGRKLGFPTANIQHPAHQFLPATGIYAGYVRIDDERLPSAVSVGYNPQFGGQTVGAEAHILDFEGDLYDRRIGLELVRRIREERVFDSVDALIEEMGRDVGQVRDILRRAEEPGELILES